MAELLTIASELYRIIDKLDFITLADSFVLNKLDTTTGHGESRLYVGPQDAHIKSFFGNFTTKCFFLRDDLLSYLQNAELEYKHPQQAYRKRINILWDANYSEVGALGTGKLLFSIQSALGSQDRSRFYVRSADSLYDLMRRIALPQISYLTILKLVARDETEYLYFRIFLDVAFGTQNNPHAIDEETARVNADRTIPVTERRQIIMARIGQGRFRDGLLAESPICPITSVNDERILVASHIKPWIDSNSQEKIDSKNGLLFTPTYDWLFDRGFISFEDDGTILISPYISGLNIKKLNLVFGRKYPVPTRGRERYLKYHRDNIFKR